MELSFQYLEAVKKFASTAHAKQTRRYSDDPYIVHPIRVMERCSQVTNEPAVLAAALLHDVLEDTAVTQHELAEFLHAHTDAQTATQTLLYVEELTDIFIKSTHPRFNRKQRKIKEAERLSRVSKQAQTIKYADIIDNTDVALHEPDFAVVYLKEALHLLAVMTNGEHDLRQQAIEKVNACLELLRAPNLSQKG